MIITVTLNPAVDITLTVQTFAPGDVSRAVETQKSAGGKGINVSRSLRVLGMPNIALTVIGSDSVREFQRLARESEIQMIYISAPGEIRSNIHVHDLATGHIFKVNQPGNNIAETHFHHFKLLFRQQLKTASAVALGGSLPPGCPISCYRELAELAQRHNVLSVVDAVGPVLLDSLAAKPYVAKPNRSELEETLGRKLRTEKQVIGAARELNRRGAQWAIITDGAKPVIATSANEIYRVMPRRIRSKGTTGAGDALVAGFLAKHVNRIQFAEALRFGVAAATANCLTEEGETAVREDILKMLPSTKIEQLAS
ncbi:1-phosphofructokinase family hexose kinase [Candidatus Sumerlaeota bacterium]|nr:1-phosphofructokinase family hexose kinase [Candidatus Sumerlaeota bacterium]